MLLVEDDRNIRALVRAILEPELEIVEAATIAAGRAALDSVVPDVVLLDMMLPDGEGLTLLPDIPVRVPVIAMTGSDKLIDAPGRVVSYLPKPFDPPNLEWLVESAIRSSKTRARPA